MAILRADDVAHYLLVTQDLLNTVGPITNLKLQKLCYYAQGFALVKLERPLFFDDINHWQHGPVIPSLWRKYKASGAAPIPVPNQPIDPELFPQEIVGVLDDVIERYGSMSGLELRDQTHREPPWIDTPDGAPITHQKIRAYFGQLIEEMEAMGQCGPPSSDEQSLSSQMAADPKFMEQVALGLAELSDGRYSKLEDVRRSLCDV